VAPPGGVGVGTALRFGPTVSGCFCWSKGVLAGLDGVMTACEPGPVVTLVWALDEVFIGVRRSTGRGVRGELEAACERWDCWLDEDTLGVFAAEIAAGERVEIDAGMIRVPVPLGGRGEVDWRAAPF
jgi:hypothetical protein